MKIMTIVWIAIILLIGYWAGKNFPNAIPLPRVPAMGA